MALFGVTNPLMWYAFLSIIPLIILWIIKFKILKKYVSAHLFTILCSILCSAPWDYISIKKGIWYFTEPEILGIWFLGLPLEEWMFITFVSLFICSGTVLMINRFGGIKDDSREI